MERLSSGFSAFRPLGRVFALNGFVHNHEDESKLRGAPLRAVSEARRAFASARRRAASATCFQLMLV